MSPVTGTSPPVLCRRYWPEASTPGQKPEAARPRVARAWRTRDSASFRSRFVVIARAMSESSWASLNFVHQLVRATGCMAVVEFQTCGTGYCGGL